MPHIFALQGRAKCGKTPTLNLVYNEIRNKYNVQPSQIQHLPPAIAGEVKVILSAIKGCKVGIASQGDSEPYFILDKTLDDFENAGCDIIFCACRTRGKTVECIKAHTKYTHHFIPQNILPAGSTPQQETQSNTHTAQTLIQYAGL
jgi:hypothetical protein